MTWTESKKEALAQAIIDGMDMDGVLELAYSHVLRHLDTLDPEELSIEAENFDLDWN